MPMTPETPAPSWAMQTLASTMRVAVFGGLASWQLVMMWAAATAEVDVPRTVLLALHAAVLGVALCGLRTDLHVGILLASVYAVLFVDYAAAADLDGGQNLAAMATATMTAATPVLVLRGRAAIGVPLTAIALLVVNLRILHPAWGTSPILTTVTGAVATIAAASLLMVYLRRLATGIDAESAEVEGESARADVTRVVSRESAENARLVHDTIINTLGAVANGAGGVAHRPLVQDRCARDLIAVESLLAGRRAPVGGLRQALDGVHEPIEIRRTGLEDEQIDARESMLPAETSRGLQGVVLELVRNAAKHSGADHVRVDVSLAGGELVVTVADDGVGFDAGSANGIGLRDSIFARSRDVGITIDLDTAEGRGTRATVRCSDIGPQVDDIFVAAPLVDAMRRSACWVWAVGIVAAGLLVEVANRPGQVTTAPAATVLVGLLCLVSWWACRDGRALPGWVAVVVVIGVPAGYVLNLGSVDFGRGDVHFLQVIGLTPLLAVLLVTAPSRRPLTWAVSLLCVTASVAAALMWGTDRDAAAVLLIAAFPQLSLFAGWYLFYRLLGTFADRSESDRRQRYATDIEVSTRTALEVDRARWGAAGLRSSSAILRDIAVGTADPTADRVQAMCADEEQYLRQLLLLSPDLVLLNPWLSRALFEARARSVVLSVRTGARDVPDRESAAAVGEQLLSWVEASRPGDALSLGVFGQGDALSVVLVAPAALIGVRPADLTLPPQGSEQRRQVGHECFVEMVFRGRRPDVVDTIGMVSAVR